MNGYFVFRSAILFLVLAISGCGLPTYVGKNTQTIPKSLPPPTALDEYGKIKDDSYYKKIVHFGTTRHDKCSAFGSDSNCLESPHRLDTGNRNTEKSISYGAVTVKIPYEKEVGSTHGIELLKIENNAKLVEFLSRLTKDDLLIFVHGYNTSFSSAAIRSAQLSHDTNFPGEMVLYSWPSEESVFNLANNYKEDKKRAQENHEPLADFLQNISGNTNKRIHIIAHSMGTSILIGSFAVLSQRIKDNPALLKNRQTNLSNEKNQESWTIFNQVILAAPDIDREEFKTIYAGDRLSKIARKITIYGSTNDNVLKVSKIINRDNEPRLGDSAKGRFPIYKGVDTVEAGLEISSQFFGHSFYAEYPSLISDIHILLNYDAPPERRMLLEAVTDKNELLWFIRRGERK